VPVKTDFSKMDCPIARTLDVVGECWTLLIIRDVILGKRRFDEFQESLGIATNVLTARLKRLIEAGILERRPYQKNPVRYEYHLTEKGRQLGPIIRDLKNWGERFLPERRRSA
jgi:DNA-binding HxlR family transcriptional regulator